MLACSPALRALLLSLFSEFACLFIALSPCTSAFAFFPLGQWILCSLCHFLIINDVRGAMDPVKMGSEMQAEGIRRLVREVSKAVESVF